MKPSELKTPGVYITEKSAFPNQVIALPTAVPAFIGYTAQAISKGISVHNKPFKINSLADFVAIFGKGPTPEYDLEQVPSKPVSGDFITIANQYYTLRSDPESRYYLYNSIRWFFMNGGGEAYIVSVGAYGPVSGKFAATGAPIVNTNVRLADLLAGLAALQQEQAPTLYLCPDACLLTTNDNGALMQALLTQCGQMQTAMSLLDVAEGRNPDSAQFMNGINQFRDRIGQTSLKYGAAYYPFVNTSVADEREVNYTNLFGGDIQSLIPILNPASAPDPATSNILAGIQSGASQTVDQFHQALMASSAGYRQIIRSVLADLNLLPPSSAIAGQIITVDSTRGVWKAPANVALNGALNLSINLTNTEQESLNVDAVSGKSINAIRNFSGQGLLVWGARTLDGNGQDWRYINVRRTATWIEQSCKTALQAYVFEPNNQTTWLSVTDLISNFLNNIWRSGALAGASPADAYQVQCGLGTTMTSRDVELGILRVYIRFAMIRPAEFIVITIEQQMP